MRMVSPADSEAATMRLTSCSNRWRSDASCGFMPREGSGIVRRLVVGNTPQPPDWNYSLKNKMLQNMSYSCIIGGTQAVRSIKSDQPHGLRPDRCLEPIKLDQVSL